MADKVVNKVVRVEVTDGRTYLATFNSMDKTGALFVMDALEIIQVDKLDMQHDMYIPYVINRPAENTSKVYKYMGNIVIKREHIKRILLDKKANEFYSTMKSKILDRSFVNE